MEGRGGVVIILFVMSAIDISTLPISKIKSALKDLGLSGSGTKKELIERYNEYMKNPEKSVASENAGKEAEVAMDHESVSNVAVKEESAIMKEGAEKSGAVQESGSNGKVVATEAPAVEAVSAEAAAAAPEAVPNAASEAVPTEAAPVETAPVETAPTETAPTESTSIKSTTTTSPTIDIDAELARREERAKRFGGVFDREQCREQLLKQQQQAAAVSLRETRRARFGASDAEKKQQRGSTVRSDEGKCRICRRCGEGGANRQVRSGGHVALRAETFAASRAGSEESSFPLTCLFYETSWSLTRLSI